MNREQRKLISRRIFVGRTTACALAALGFPAAGANERSKLKAAVIGHTGRGDYGHGLDAIFVNRPNIDLVALADPDSEGRNKMAAKLGAPRAYADYRDLLEKERPQLVSIAMRQADQHHAIALAALKMGAHI